LTRFTIVLAAAALLGTDCVARADGPQLAANGIPVGGGVSGGFSGPGTQTWRVYLQRGMDYAVDGAGDCVSSVAVRAAGGKALATFGFSGEDESDGNEGASLRAPYTGLYTVDVTVSPDRFPACGPQGRYGLSASRDCPGDTATRCGIVVGQTLQNLHLDYQGDADWFRARLSAGRTYRVTMAAQLCNNLAVLDARGGRLAGNDCAISSEPGVLTFTAPADGTYYLAARAFADPPEPYSLSLAPVR
jgi:hypothetical protein